MMRFLFALLVFAGAVAAQEYQWPTDASRLLTSSFAESRSGRFHAGIDIKTWGQTGFPVVAVRDGYVSRISVSPFGYGRALYLTLDTGETALYAHLERFADPIERFVKNEQKRRDSYEIQLFPAAEQFTFRKGEIVAYSGESGVGHPHLHFELRDRHGDPVNPFLRRYTVEDRTAPVITRVLIQPLDAFSTVNHDWEPVVIYPVKENGRSYRLPQAVTVSGRIGFGISVFDRMDDADHTFGIYGNELRVDDRLVYAARYDGFPYAMNAQFKLDRDYRQMVRGNLLFYNLFRDFGNRLPFNGNDDLYSGVVDFYDDGREEQAIEIPSGVTRVRGREHRFVIRTYDFWGNAAEVSGTLIVDGDQATFLPDNDDEDDNLDGQELADSVHLYDVSWRFYDRYLRIKLTAQRPQLGAPEVHGELCRGKSFVMPVRKVGALTFIGAWPLSDCSVGPLQLTIYPQDRSAVQKQIIRFETVPRGKPKTLSFDDGRCMLSFNTVSLFKDLFLRAVVDDTAPFGTVGPLYRFEPTDVPLNEGALLTIRYPQNDPSPTKLAIYQKSGDKLLFVDNTLNGEERTVTAKVRAMGAYALARDVKPPVIVSLSPAEGLRTRQRRPKLQAVFRDDLSGIGGENSRVLKLDDVKVIAEYDYERALLFYQPEESLNIGAHTVEVFVRDRSGNTASLKHTFHVE